MNQESDTILLHRFLDRSDSEAFDEIVRRYSGLVYSACQRVLQNPHQAADAAQETFFQLFRHAGQITDTLAGWLHKVATRRALDIVRKEGRRNQRRHAYRDQPSSTSVGWEEISPLIDEALLELENPVRRIIVCHFLEKQTQADIAADMNISQATVSRRIDIGLQQLRRALEKRGIVISSMVLTTMMLDNSAIAVPMILVKELGKMSLIGQAQTGTVIGSGMAHSAGSIPAATLGSLAIMGKTKIITISIVVVLGLCGVALFRQREKLPEKLPVQESPIRQDKYKPRSRQSRPTPARTTIKKKENLPVDPVSSQTSKKEDTTPAEPTVVPKSSSPILQEPEVIPEIVAEPEIDLSTPESTVHSFMKMVATGDAEKVLACFLPGGVDYEDAREIMDADADNSKYDLKMWLMSFDPDAEMPVQVTEVAPRVLKVSWLATFKKEFTMKGHTFLAGDTLELDATLKQIEDKWLIDNF